MRQQFILALSALLGTAVLAANASAAGPPVTGTDMSVFSESFADEPFLCQDQLYAQTVSGHALVSFTYFPDTGAVRLHEDVHAEVVAVPLDGTGPTYTGHFWFSDTETIRAVRNGDLLVEQDTDFNHVVARGSDGSRVLADYHAHFTVNANGELAVQFESDKTVCA
ncbi:MAG TPA: hypothetical protein VLD16_05895 [Gaiellaceae bacterium]|nr:hypothetical protein [Gaiellaceae bacterium]